MLAVAEGTRLRRQCQDVAGRKGTDRLRAGYRAAERVETTEMAIACLHVMVDLLDDEVTFWDFISGTLSYEFSRPLCWDRPPR